MSEAYLSGKVALVTGGSRGIGAATSKRLAADGAMVLVNYAKNAAAAKKVVDEIVAAGGKAAAIAGDVGTPEGVAALLEAIDKQHGGRVDILVNNAGVFITGDSDQRPDVELDATFDVNVRGPYHLSREIAKRMPDGGRIINIGSGVGERVPMGGMTVYAASKFAIAGITHGLAQDYAKRGITVNLIQPGPIDTDMNPADPSKNPMADGMKSMIPLGRYGTADEVAHAIAFFTTPLAGFITASTINVDGGWLA